MSPPLRPIFRIIGRQDNLKHQNAKLLQFRLKISAWQHTVGRGLAECGRTPRQEHMQRLQTWCFPKEPVPKHLLTWPTPGITYLLKKLFFLKELELINLAAQEMIPNVKLE